MSKPFAAFDVDGTIFKSSLVEKVVDECIEEGLFSPESFEAAFSNKDRWQNSNNEGVYQSYLQPLVRGFISEMAGVEVERFNQVTSSMLARQAVRKFAFPRRLMNGLRETHHMVAISGSPDIIVEPFLADLGVQMVYGSRFEVEDGIFTGKATPVGDKQHVLQELTRDGVISRAGSVAIGDTYNDIPMLGYADAKIMFNASRNLTNYGSQFHWLRVNEVKDQITALQWDEATTQYIECEPQAIIYSARS